MTSKVLLLLFGSVALGVEGDRREGRGGHSATIIRQRAAPGGIEVTIQARGVAVPNGMWKRVSFAREKHSEN